MLSNMSTSSSVRISGNARKKAGPLVRNPRSSCSSTGAGDAGADSSAAGHAVTVPPAPFGNTSPITVVTAMPERDRGRYPACHRDGRQRQPGEAQRLTPR